MSITLIFLFIAKTSPAQLPEIHRFQKFELNVNPVTDISNLSIKSLAQRHFKNGANNPLPEIFGIEDPTVDFSDFVIANNDLLKVADLKGNEVWLANLIQNQQGCVVEVKNWKPGIYVFTYWHDGKPTASTKVAIQ